MSSTGSKEGRGRRDRRKWVGRRLKWSWGAVNISARRMARGCVRRCVVDLSLFTYTSVQDAARKGQKGLLTDGDPPIRAVKAITEE